MLDLQQFEEDGFYMRSSLLSPAEIANLITLIEENTLSEPRRGGVRDVMHRVPALQKIAENPRVRAIAEQVLGTEAFVVRATLFDKTDGANWKVPWHQDVTIAVRERRETEGYGPWSMKQGVVHVQPPTAVLEHMLTVRIHLDPCPLTNGPLRVMPGTHHLGRIDQNEAPQYVCEESAVHCAAAPGEALVMRPMLLHASSPAAKPTHRRVIHFDFANTDLSNGLEWRMRPQHP